VTKNKEQRISIFNSIRFFKQFTQILVFAASLAVHLSIDLTNDQHDVQIFNTFITVLYMYMFRALSCSSSGGQIVLIQHLVSSLSVSDHVINVLRICASSCSLAKVIHTISGSWFRASAMTTMNKNEPDAQQS
jgi:hypothetical protein